MALLIEMTFAEATSSWRRWAPSWKTCVKLLLRPPPTPKGSFLSLYVASRKLFTQAISIRSLAEGEAAFLSLVMQAASSEPIDELSQDNSESSHQISASLPDQLLESFIVR